MASVTAAPRVVTAKCPGCGEPRELTVRQARRAGLCSLCRSHQNITSNDEDLWFWFVVMDDEEIALLLSEIRGQPYEVERVAQVRLALMVAQEEARPARLLSSVPQQAGLVA